MLCYVMLFYVTLCYVCYVMICYVMLGYAIVCCNQCFRWSPKRRSISPLASWPIILDVAHLHRQSHRKMWTFWNLLQA